ncbi:MAG: 50S ribosomal protein L24 [archaeon]|nr:50S ribosomal protein L24 [archaeon]
MASVRLTLGATRLRLAPKKRIKDRQVETFQNWKILRGDTVQVTTGKDAGQKGVVVKAIRSRNSVVVEGLNLVKKHLKGNREQKGGIITKSMPIHISNVSLIHPQTGNPTKIRRLVIGGVKSRVTPPGGEGGSVVIPRPDILKQRRRPLPKAPGPMDTACEVARKITYSPPPRTLTPKEEISKEKAKSGAKPLPQGVPVGPKSIWLKYLTQESVPYYYNSRTHESTWLLPNNTNRSRVVEAGEVANDGVVVNEEDNQ